MSPLTAAIVWGIIWFFLMYAGPILAQIITVFCAALVAQSDPFSALGTRVTGKKKRVSVTGPLVIVVILAWIGALAWVVFCIIQWVLQIVSIIQIATA
jgi:hypothetical protein